MAELPGIPGWPGSLITIGRGIWYGLGLGSRSTLFSDFFAQVAAARTPAPTPAAPIAPPAPVPRPPAVTESGTLEQIRGFVAPGVPQPPPVIWRPPTTTPPINPNTQTIPRVPGAATLPAGVLVRVLARVLGLPGLIFYPSTTADDDEVPEGFPYPQPLPEPATKGPPRRPVVRPDTAPAWPAPDWWNYPQPRAPARRWRFRRFPWENPTLAPGDWPFYVPEVWQTPVRLPGTQPGARPAARPATPGTRPAAPPRPVLAPVPLRFPTPTPTPLPFRPLSPLPLPITPTPARPITPTPSRPITPTPLRPTLPLPLTPGITQPVPFAQPTPTSSSRCPPCEQVKRRRRKKGQCRQGYFREFPDRTEYITWSKRKCP